MQLTPVEARVLGSLMEKEVTTPDLYPLSLNALIAACNQKSSREPVMSLTEGEVRDALRSLEDLDLVSVDHGSRVARYENRARTVFQLRRDEAAVMCLLLLRGPQTPGELRSRADRLYSFDDVPAVLSALNRLATASDTRPERLLIALQRQPGMKEQRYAHLLTDRPAMDAMASAGDREMSSMRFAGDNLPERVARLEAEVELLQSRLHALLTTSSAAGANRETGPKLDASGPAQEEAAEEA